MANKSRMGRNLNALLGGATRNRRTEPETESAATTAESDTTKHQSENEQNTLERAESVGAAPSVPSPTDTTSAPARSSEASDASRSAGLAQSSVGQSSTSSKNSAAASAASESEPNLNTTAASTSAAPASASTTNNAAQGNLDNPNSIDSGNNTLRADSHPSDRLRMLGVDQITRGMYQPRRHFDQALLQELADSIKAQGLIQPILVRAYGGKFELIAGERRWRAAQLAGISDIPAIVRDMDDQSVAAVSLIENIQRADLNPLEEAQALERLCGEFSMTHQQVAEAVGRSRVAVTNLMRLLELHDDVKKMVDNGELDMGHARALLGAPRADQAGIAKRIVQQGLTVRAVEKLVKDLREGKPSSTSEAPKADPNIEALGQKLGKKLGAPVNIKHQQNGSGKLEITYSSIDELEGILKHFK